MKPRLLPALAIAMAGAWLPLPAVAQTTPVAQSLETTSAQSTATAAPPSDYMSTDSGLGLPSGLIGLGIGQPGGFTEALPTTAPSVEAIQGCGTVGIEDYTGQLYNNPKVFERFSQQDVNSDLARQLLTYNYSMPQTAALFAQLNQFGNERYRQFQQGCALTAQQADAKRMFLQACVSQMMSGNNIVSNTLQASTGDSRPKNDELEARKIARAYELCTQQYTDASRSLLKQKSESYAQAVRKAQDVNRMLRPLLCPFATAVTGFSEQRGQACWPNLFLPQVRLMAEGVNDTNPTVGFGVRAAPLAVSSFLDGLRTSVGGSFMTEVFTPFRQTINLIDQAKLTESAEIAVRAIAATPPKADMRARAFMVDFLNCKNPDLALPIKEYAKAIQGSAPPMSQEPFTSANTASTIQFSSLEYGPSQTQVIADRMLPAGGTNADEAIQADRADLASLIDIAAGCAANQQIPFLDPMVLARLNSCQTNDQNAFFEMASYDVAVTATRNVLNYTKSRLEMALGRLEAGDQSSLLALQADNTIPDSPAIRERLATAIRTIMLPHIDQQLTRLAQFETTRGAFGQRVSAVYQQKARCLFSD